MNVFSIIGKFFRKLFTRKPAPPPPVKHVGPSLRFDNPPTRLNRAARRGKGSGRSRTPGYAGLNGKHVSHGIRRDKMPTWY